MIAADLTRTVSGHVGTGLVFRIAAQRLSVDELASVHDTVQSKLSQPPHPKIEDLDTRSRCALEIYQSIPTRLNDAGRSKAGSWLGGWS